MVKFDFYHSKLRKTFLLKISKSMEFKAPLTPIPMPMTADELYGDVCYCRWAIKKAWVSRSYQFETQSFLLDCLLCPKKVALNRPTQSAFFIAQNPRHWNGNINQTNENIQDRRFALSAWQVHISKIQGSIAMHRQWVILNPFQMKFTSTVEQH